MSPSASHNDTYEFDEPVREDDELSGAGKHVFVVGDPESVFMRVLVDGWIACGATITLVTAWRSGRDWPCEVLHPNNGLNALERRAFHLLRWLLLAAERVVDRIGWDKNAIEGSFDWGSTGFRPRWSTGIHRGLMIAWMLRRRQVRTIFVQEAFAFGSVLIFAKAKRKVLFPWGADVFVFKNKDRIARWLIDRVVRSSDFIVPSSEHAAALLRTEYGLTPSNCRNVSWGVDTGTFRPASEDEKYQVRERFGFSRDCRIVLNARRFQRPWGSHLTIDAFAHLALRYPSVRFVALGAGTESEIGAARAKLQSAGVSERVRIIDGHLSLQDFAGIVSISEIFVSAMTIADMRSSSILQAAASGGVPVLVDQPEYQNMARDGFRYEAVSASSSEIADAIEKYLNDPNLIADVRQANFDYIGRHEVSVVQMKRLLNISVGLD